ncbi:DUF6622 family protein [Acidovorax sp.]|uniref:DUF6622 family protein n=1 Tax=Acidovorax sp. TaxID=1872122 RepID=UPI0025C04A71|nr:DUF6622 family protein [Acidovorax sp.]MBL7089629.1 hypothetical protein [Acidovorax sp.]
MLLNLLVQQPQMLGRIIENTPYWVWALLAGLLWLGGSQLLARSVGLVRAMAMPVAMTGLSVFGIASAFGGAGQALLPVGAWLVTAVLIARVALWLQPVAPQGTLYEGQSRCFYIPGSAMPLALILGIFLTKYLVGVELALQPALARDSGFALQIAALYGVFNGLFAARALRLWKLVQRSAPLATSPATA